MATGLSAITQGPRALLAAPSSLGPTGVPIGQLPNYTNLPCLRSALRIALPTEQIDAPAIFEKDPLLEALIMETGQAPSWEVALTRALLAAGDRRGFDITVWSPESADQMIRDAGLPVAEATLGAIAADIRAEWHWFERAVGQKPHFAVLRLEWTTSVDELNALFRGPAETAVNRIHGFTSELEGACHQDEFSWIDLRCLRVPGTLIFPGYASSRPAGDHEPWTALRSRIELHAGRIQEALTRFGLAETESTDPAPILQQPHVRRELLQLLRDGARSLRAAPLDAPASPPIELLQGARALFQGNEAPGRILLRSGESWNPRGLVHTPPMDITYRSNPRLLLMVRC